MPTDALVSNSASIGPPTCILDLAMEWSYLDLQGQVQGPFKAWVMQIWSSEGYFTDSMRLKRTTFDTEWETFGELKRRAGNNSRVFLTSIPDPPGLTRQTASPTLYINPNYNSLFQPSPTSEASPALSGMSGFGIPSNDRGSTEPAPPTPPSISLPKKVPVIRHKPLKDTLVPSFVWVLPARDGTLERSTLIRQEYYGAILSILQWIRDGHMLAEKQRLEMEQEHSSTRTDVEVKMEDEELTVWDVPLTDDNIRFISGEQLDLFDTFPNPFVGSDGSITGDITCNAGIIVTGLPGIGKTRFLHFIWSLRCNLNLPTLYMDRPTIAFLWKEKKLRILEVDRFNSDQMISTLPKTTWCLVDSMDVPDYIHLTCRFILQTSSSKNTRMEWMKKSEAGAMREYFVMRPWSLSELIAGNQLQAWTRGMLAEDALRSFHERYGGSARDAYAFARRPSAFDKKITTATQAMAGYDDRRLENIWSSEPFYLDVPKDAGHALLSVFPVSDIDRCQFRIASPSKAMQSEVLKLLADNEEAACQRLYRIYLRAETVGCKSLASDLLDIHFHTFLTRGGSWDLREMAVISPDSRTWRADGPITHVLIVDETIKLVVRSQALSVANPTSLRIKIFDQDNQPSPLVRSTYYQPTHRNFAAFDAFYVDRDGHAIAFKTTTAASRKVATTGLDWLKEHGIRKATYILLTPPTTIPYITDVDTSFFDEIFYMAFTL